MQDSRKHKLIRIKNRHSIRKAKSNKTNKYIKKLLLWRQGWVEKH